MNIRAAIALAIAAPFFVSCADDYETQGEAVNGGLAVNFTINNEGITRSVVSPYQNDAIGVRRFEATSSDGSETMIVESTLEGMSNLASAPQTRANVKTAIDADFSTLAYSGTSPAGISNTPNWFYNARTQSDGVLYDPIYWEWSGNRFARFYGVYPEVKAGDSKMKLSDKTYAGVPYVDFEVETDVTKQVDFMTACSGNVEYAQQMVAPDTYLNFRHALTAIKFAVGQNLSYDKVIDRVEIRNAMSKGRYTMATDATGANAAWSEHSTPATFKLEGLNISTKANPNVVLTGNDGDNYTFYMLPQQLTGKNVEVFIHFTDDTNITAKLSGEWLAGTTKTYKLSNNSSTWTYILESTSPAAIAYNQTTTANYGIVSYRQAPDGTIQPVEWNVIGYDANGDNNFSMDEKPEWLTSVSKTSGTGTQTATGSETGNGVFRLDVKDMVAERNNSLKNAPAKGSASNYYDLSMYKADGTSTARNTANTYLISAPGYYKIPLVYGNAVKDGNNNTSAYQNNSFTTTNGYYNNLLDHNNNPITNPYINEQLKDNPAVSAAIVWSDGKGRVINPTIVGSGTEAYLQFQVPQGAMKQGNTSVAIKNKDGVVVWSWNLWFAPASALNTIAVTNNGKTYSFTEENLGWMYLEYKKTTYDAPRTVRVKVQQAAGQAGGKQETVVTLTQNNAEVKQGDDMLYQYGRHSGLPAQDRLHPIEEGAIATGTGAILSNFIQNPDKFYIQDESWSVYSGSANEADALNVWNMAVVPGTNTPTNTVKTVYDPTPAGFCLPVRNAFDGVKVAGEFNNGYNLYWSDASTTVYFPTTGYYYQKGNFSSRTNRGMYWSATPNGYGNGYMLFMNETKTVDVRSNYRFYGFSIRPILQQ